MRVRTYRGVRLTHSAADLILTILQVMTQKQASKYLDASERSIRRWKNEGVIPTPEHLKTLRTKAKYVRSKIRKSGGDLSPIPVATDKPGKDETLRLSPKNFKFDNFLNLIKWYRDNTTKTMFRLLLRVFGADIIDSDLVLNPKAKFGFLSTGWMNLTSPSGHKTPDEKIIEWLNEWLNKPSVTGINKIFVV